MHRAVLDGERIGTEAQLHEELKAQMDFPDYYGKNLDALWDCISYYGDEVIIEWKNFKVSQEKLGKERTEKFMEVFYRAQMLSAESSHSKPFTITLF